MMTETELLRELRAAVHLLHRAGGDVQVAAFDLAGRRARLVHRVHHEEEAVAPVHEGLRVDVLVVLHEVEAALEALVDHAAVVASRQAELGLGGGTQQRTAELVEPFALDHDAGRRAGEGLHIRDRELHVLEPRGLQRLEAEDVADDRCGDVGDRAFLEQAQVVGDVAEVLPGVVGHRLDLVGLGAIHVAGGETVGPHHGPGRGAGLAGHRCGGLDRVDAVLRRDAEQRQDVGVLRHVVAVPVAHLGVLQDPGGVALLGVSDLRWFVHLAHGTLLARQRFGWWFCMQGLGGTGLAMTRQTFDEREYTNLLSHKKINYV